MRYDFKPLPELYWGVTIAAALVLLQALVTLDPEAVTDWRIWAVALGGGMVRAAAGAALDYLRRSVVSQQEPAHLVATIPPELVTALADELERRREQRVRLVREARS